MKLRILFRANKCDEQGKLFHIGIYHMRHDISKHFARNIIYA